MRIINQIHFHHSAGLGDASSIIELHERLYGRVAYTAIVERNGTLKVMLSDNEIPYSVGNYLNDTALAICMVGDFTKMEPTPGQWKAAVEWVRAKAKKYNVPREKVLGHREARANSACPGFSDAICERFRFDVFTVADRELPREEDEMVRLVQFDTPPAGQAGDAVWLVDFGAKTKWVVPSPEIYNWLRAIGIQQIGGQDKLDPQPHHQLFRTIG